MHLHGAKSNIKYKKNLFIVELTALSIVNADILLKCENNCLKSQTSRTFGITALNFQQHPSGIIDLYLKIHIFGTPWIGTCVGNYEDKQYLIQFR